MIGPTLTELGIWLFVFSLAKRTVPVLRLESCRTS